MTLQEQSIADDKMRAEIARLISETAKITAETAEIQQNMKYRFWVLMAACSSGGKVGHASSNDIVRSRRSRTAPI